MEVKKNFNSNKVAAKKKQPPATETKSVEAENLQTEVPKPDLASIPKVEPIDIPKVKSESNYKSLNHFETIKQKRDQMFQQEKNKQKQIKENAVVARKQMRVFQITLAITLLVLIFFAPIYPNQNFKITDRNYLRMADIKIEHPLGDYISPFSYLRYEMELREGSEFIKSVDMEYQLRKMRVVVRITEYKPLAKDVENNVYFYEDDEVVKKSGLDIYAPVISGFDQKTLEKLLKSLNSLDYDVIQQIDTIEYIGTEEDPDLLKLGMEGDNTVYIDIDQIKHKLPYYNQMKQIIDEKADGKPGIIHLDIGDYYEPK